MVILRQTEKSVVRAMCGVNLTDRKNTKELTGTLGLQETVDKLARASGVRWYKISMFSERMRMMC